MLRCFSGNLSWFYHLCFCAMGRFYLFKNDFHIMVVFRIYWTTCRTGHFYRTLLVSYLKCFHRISREMSNTQNFTHMFINSISFGLIQPLSGMMGEDWEISDSKKYIKSIRDKYFSSLILQNILFADQTFICVFCWIFNFKVFNDFSQASKLDLGEICKEFAS